VVFENSGLMRGANCRCKQAQCLGQMSSAVTELIQRFRFWFRIRLAKQQALDIT